MRDQHKTYQAIWNGAVLAESDRTVQIEGNQYFPPDSVNRDYVRPSSHTSVCAWKGTASYYTLEVEGSTNRDAAWYYPNPSAAARAVEGHVAFWKGVQVVQAPAGVPAAPATRRPQTGGED